MRKQWIRICLFSFIFSSFFMNISEAYAQDVKLTLKLENVSLRELLTSIEEQTDYRFSFRKSVIDENLKLSVSKKDSNVTDILNDVLKGTGLSYRIVSHNSIVIESVNNLNSDDFDNDLKRIKGIVKDSNGEPIIGANIIVQGSSVGCITDFEGAFSLDVPKDSKIVVSYIGYQTQVLNVGNKENFFISLKDDSELLNEVVVVGYGTQRKRDLTGSIGSVKTDELPKAAKTSIGQMLSGQIAGLRVIQNSSQPGGGLTFSVRGGGSVNAGNEPLIIIDGVPSNGGISEQNSFYSSGSKSPLNSINPNDIESVEVLKDASSTAIYGARAANGVVLITTKRGKEGKPRVSYDGSVSIQKIAEIWDMLSPQEYMIQTNRYLKEIWMYDNNIGIYGGKNPDDAKTPFTPRYDNEQIRNTTTGTDWLNAIMRTGFVQQHNLSLNGGTATTKYLVSLNYYDQSGIIKNNDFERFTGRFNLDQDINKYIRTGLSGSFSRNKNNNIPLNGGSGLDSFGILQLAMTANPTLPIKDEDGNYVQDPNNTFTPNPVSLLEISDESILEHTLASAYLEINPFKDLMFRANFGYDRSSTRRGQYIPTTTMEGKKMGGYAGISNSRNENYLFEFFGKYSNTIKEHSFSALAGYSYQYFSGENSSMNNREFISDVFLWNNIGAGAAERPDIVSSAYNENLLSFYSRINYDYKKKYLLTFNLRADASPKFSKKNRWGIFPSISGGWRVSDENFFKPLESVVSNFKIRAGYGTTGNASIGIMAMEVYNIRSAYPFNMIDHKGGFASQLANPSLKWETTKEFNVGLDYGFFNERISGSLDYYDRIIDDLLGYRSLLPYHEITRISANTGATRMKGVEFNLNAHILRGLFNWDLGVTVSKNTIKWHKRDEAWKPAIYEKENDPLRAIYTYVSDGLIQVGEEVPHMPGAVPGGVKYKDINGFKRDEAGNPIVDKNGKFVYLGKPDGILDDADKVLLGSWDPGMEFGINTYLSYKNFDLSVNGYGRLNYFKDNYARVRYSLEAYRLGEGFNMLSEVKDAFTSDNLNGTRPNLIFKKAPYSLDTGDYNIEKINFFRLQNITLGYTLPSNKIKLLSKLRVYVSFDNLFVLTDYSGIDPETDGNFGYPNQRTFTLGTNITF